jgi:hypothetical protein
VSSSKAPARYTRSDATHGVAVLRERARRYRRFVVKRIQIILGALAIVVTSFAAISGPALAADLDCRDARGDLIRCDGDLYSPYDDDDDDGYYFHNSNNYWDDDYYYFSPFFFNPYYYGGFDDYSYGCEGPVCLID